MEALTLHKIAKEISLSRQDKSDIYIPNYILFGREAISEMNTRGFVPIQSVALDIDPNTNSATLPPDYLGYVRVGICVCGRIIELDYDKTLCVREPVDNFCCAEEEVSKFEEDCKCLSNNCIPDGYSNYYMWNNIYYRGTMLDPIYTLPAYRSKGFFKISNGRIYFNSVCANGQVILQYKSTGVSDSGQTEIPYNLKDVIKYYIVWKNAFFDNNTPLAKVAMYKEEYNRKKDLITLQEVLVGITDMLKVQMEQIYQANLSR